MESIIKVTQGAELTHTCNCHFCSKSATTTFAIISKEKQWNGHHMDGFPICDEHLEALNHILDGQYDIDKLIKTYDDIIVGETINLRA